MVTIERKMFTTYAEVINWMVEGCGPRLNGCLKKISNNLKEREIGYVRNLIYCKTIIC